MSLTSPVSRELAEPLAHRLHLLAEPMRLRLLYRLREGEATVRELAVDVGTSQQNASKHLALLADAGLLARRRDGNKICYQLTGHEVIDICDRAACLVQRQLLDLAQLGHRSDRSPLGRCRDAGDERRFFDAHLRPARTGPVRELQIERSRGPARRQSTAPQKEH